MSGSNQVEMIADAVTTSASRLETLRAGLRNLDAKIKAMTEVVRAINAKICSGFGDNK